MDQPVADDGIPLRAGIELGVGRLGQQALRLLQGGPHADADTQQAVPGGLTPAREDLVEIDLADAGAAGQFCLGKALLHMETGQEGRYALLGKEGGVFMEIGVKVRLAHQLLGEIVGGSAVHRDRSSLF